MSREPRFKPTEWALILGASSGFGAGCAIELAKRGINIFGVHLDRRPTLPAVQETIKQITDAGSKALFFNINAADPVKRNEVLDEIKKQFSHHSSDTIKLLLHSLAFGTLKPFISQNPDEMISQAQMEMTLDVMANSLVYWTQGVITRKLMKRGGRILGMTSSGGHSALPHYGAVSAAKASLESYARQLAMELGPYGITVNTILAGVTDTPAQNKIPGAMEMLAIAREKIRNFVPQNREMLLTLSHYFARMMHTLFPEMLSVWTPAKIR